MHGESERSKREYCTVLVEGNGGGDDDGDGKMDLEKKESNLICRNRKTFVRVVLYN